MANAEREQWSTSFGFVAAAVGSAVGLGNMWRFSYLTAEKGGAAFVGLYLIFTLLVGLPILLAEMTIGRGASRSPVLALEHYGGRSWRLLGVLFVLTGFLILSYYSVIAGWTLRYAGELLWHGVPLNPGDHFSQVSQGWPAFLFHVSFMALTMAIVAGGVKRGIERVSVIAMPVLFVFVCGLALYAATLSGSEAGYAYYLNANFTNALSMDVVVSAAGQSFFSLSLGMGAMLTFASYLSRQSDLPREAIRIAAADFGVAFVAGLMVFPIVFALGVEGDVSESTLGALFVALPEAFSSMGLVGRFVGVIFFVALIVGALTSAISLLEVVVSAAVDGWAWSRGRAVIVAGGLITLIGSFAAWDLALLDAMDQVANNILLLLGALLLSVFVGWVMKNAETELAQGAGRLNWVGVWRFLLRWWVPIVLLFVLFHSVPKTLSNVRNLVFGLD
ncbi:MAG: sodium-dependent transporter [Myxococcota bacterium]|nr:sodium-dependent transporter [Myxococcota bacterium]